MCVSSARTVRREGGPGNRVSLPLLRSLRLGALLIERDAYRIGRWGLRPDGTCACGFSLPGRFEARPGTWGARRLPIQLGA